MVTILLGAGSLFLAVEFAVWTLAATRPTLYPAAICLWIGSLALINLRGKSRPSHSIAATESTNRVP